MVSCKGSPYVFLPNLAGSHLYQSKDESTVIKDFYGKYDTSDSFRKEKYGG